MSSLNILVNALDQHAESSSQQQQLTVPIPPPIAIMTNIITGIHASPIQNDTDAHLVTPNENDYGNKSGSGGSLPAFTPTPSIFPTTTNTTTTNTASPNDTSTSTLPPLMQVDEILLPCRARRMGPTHNFNMAHFRISSQTPHGAELYCSHVKCRQEGVKFRYCGHCRIPVAKRNFRNRHSHRQDPSFHQRRIVDKMNQIDTILFPKDSNSTTSSRGRGRGRGRWLPPDNGPLGKSHSHMKGGNIAGKSITMTPIATTATTSAVPSNFVQPSHSFVLPQPKPQPQLQPQANFKQPTPTLSQSTTTTTTTTPSEVPSEWIQLYHCRPNNVKDKKDMDDWVQKVLYVSHPDQTEK